MIAGYGHGPKSRLRLQAREQCLLVRTEMHVGVDQVACQVLEAGGLLGAWGHARRDDQPGLTFVDNPVRDQIVILGK